jgi:putative oxidoreductase
MKLKVILQEVLIAALVLLYIYTAAIRLMKLEDFKLAIGAQPLVPALKLFLIYAIPAACIGITLLLAIPWFRKIGLYASLLLLLVFTGYIILIKMNYYGRIPCSCAGVLENVEWNTHLFFNLVFILINTVAILLHRQTT